MLDEKMKNLDDYMRYLIKETSKLIDSLMLNIEKIKYIDIAEAFQIQCAEKSMMEKIKNVSIEVE